ncbi:MAG TPA: GAF domain-containing protein [Acidimicrobiia bacterium]|jgi:GAF domain-containing protein
MDRTEDFGNQLDSLLEISADIASARELAEVEDRALAYCLDLTGSAFGFIGLLDDIDRDKMVVDAIRGVSSPPGFVELYRFMSVRLSVFGVVIVEDRPYRSNDVEHDPLSVGQPPGHPPVHSFLGVPLRVGAMLIGVLGVANKPGGFQADDERLLSTFANQVAIAIDNARLYEQQRELITRLVSVVDLATSGSVVGGSRRRRPAQFDASQGASAGGPPEPFGPVYDLLSDQQRAILRLISEGYSNREIASRVHLSENTVKSHIQEIFRKLGVRTRVEAAIRAARDGLV